MNEELKGLYQRILFQMDRIYKEGWETKDSVLKASKQQQLMLLFEILAPYGGTAYDIETKQYIMQHYNGEYIKWQYQKEQVRLEVGNEQR